MSMTTPHSLEQLQRDLNEAKAAAAIARNGLPDLATLRAAVAHFVAEVALDDTNRPALEAASNQLKAGVTLHAEYTVAARRVDDLTAQIGNAQFEARARRIQLADNALEIANAAYLDLGKQLVRAYRRLLIQQRISQSVPGARTTIAEGFDLEFMTPAGWNGRTSDIMRDGNLPWENIERANAAELEKAVA